MQNTPVVVINGNAGNQEHSSTKELALRRGYRIEITQYAGHGKEIALREAAQGVPLVIACGGDGTIHEIASGLLEAERNVPLGIIPSGTGNDLCRSLDISDDVEEAFRILDENRQIDIDVARLIVADRKLTFFNVSSCGFSGEVDKHLENIDKSSWGALSYFRSGLSALGDLQPFQVEVNSEGERIKVDALNVVVGNGRYAAAGIPVAHQASITDRKLDLVLYMGDGVADQIFNSPLILRGDQDNSDTILSLRSQKFAMKFSRPLAINYDGELYDKEVEEVSYEIHSKRLRVLVGRKHI